MSIPKIWKEDFTVQSFHMDPKRRAHLTSICNFLQEVAGNHADKAGFGYKEMLDKNQIWVLSRLKVVVDKFPAWNEKININTWSRGKEGIFYIRDFEIDNQQMKTIIKATSSWAAINVKSRRPEIVQGLEEGLYSLKDQLALNETLGKLPELSKPCFVRKRIIEYTDIDLVYHVNNVKYIELIYNSFPEQILMNMRIKSLEINYLGEAKYKDELQIYFESIDEASFLVSVVRDTDKRQVCKARVVWES